jgi:hypothetical protein
MKACSNFDKSSASRLLNKKLNMATSQSHTPKYVESKIYISTKQVNAHNPTNNNMSLSKTINNKLDIIKQ